MTLAKKAETWSLEKTNKIGFQQNHLTKKEKEMIMTPIKREIEP